MMRAWSMPASGFFGRKILHFNPGPKAPRFRSKSAGIPAGFSAFLENGHAIDDSRLVFFLG